MKTILIIEDDKVIAEVQKDYLEAAGFQVQIAYSGETGLQLALTEPVDLILLDLMLPGVDGYEICRRVRAQKNIPILIVSAKKEEVDKIVGFGQGADDYMIKPFGLGELVARVKAHLARFDRLTSAASQMPEAQSQMRERELLKLDGLTIDIGARKVFVQTVDVPFTSKEFELLVFLVQHPNRVFRKEELFERIWGLESLGDSATVTVHISKLREKIERNPSKPQYIDTVWGVGYRFNV